MVEKAGDSAQQRKRIILLGVGALSAVVAVLLLALFLTRPSDTPGEPTIDSQVNVSSQDQLLLAAASKDFIQSVGNFGIKPDSLNPRNIMNVKYLVGSDSPGAKEFFVTRQAAYQSTKNALFRSGPLDYDDRAVAQWSNSSETDGLVGYMVDSVTATTQPKGGRITVDGVQVETATVDVNFTSTETMRNQTADDASWDGSFAVMAKTFGNNSATITFVQDEHGHWLIYSMQGLKNQFLLATWQTPSSDAYDDAQFGFKQVDTIMSESAGGKTVPSATATPEIQPSDGPNSSTEPGDGPAPSATPSQG